MVCRAMVLHRNRNRFWYNVVELRGGILVIGAVSFAFRTGDSRAPACSMFDVQHEKPSKSALDRVAKLVADSRLWPISSEGIISFAIGMREYEEERLHFQTPLLSPMSTTVFPASLYEGMLEYRESACVRSAPLSPYFRYILHFYCFLHSSGLQALFYTSLLSFCSL